MLLQEQISARQSSIGQYGFHYPDLHAAEIVIPAGSSLDLFSWSPQNGHRAFRWNRESDSIVVWIEAGVIK